MLNINCKFFSHSFVCVFNLSVFKNDIKHYTYMEWAIFKMHFFDLRKKIGKDLRVKTNKSRCTKRTKEMKGGSVRMHLR